ncbi:glycosyltransferase [Heyndrickxia acidicola]|uniref:Glycosyltransferase n=1 Tax=Heyndrickxia acidicola TaxID=209389 RepID=A0ABU6MR11_9BACI|nr:glycosyltransferase [Heyndrickxia acidicola]MED1205485.1 glycosyltransferase [Heyndrickxia acidicola]
MMISKRHITTAKKKLYFILRPLKRFLVDTEFRKRAMYAKYTEKKPVNNRIIFYEAYHGQSMTGNPYAVFKYLIDHNDYQNCLHVWAIADKSQIQDDYKTRRNVIFVKYRSAAYIKCLAVAKYLINDTTFPYYFHKRKEQIYANIWHGTPLKKMGIDIPVRGLSDHKNIQKNFLFSNYMVSPNRFTAETLLKSHDVYSLYNGSILDTGYPRGDLMYQADQQKIKALLSIPEEKKIILYAPTWRGRLGEEVNESEALLQSVQEIQQQAGENYIVLLKSHYYAYKFFNQNQMGHLCVPNKLDTNELLSIVDMLITDYSSIFFEYLPTKKPVIFFTYDDADYLKERGTYIPLEALPGPVCRTLEEVIHAIQHSDEEKEQYAAKYQHFLQTYCYNDDGLATQRFIETVFQGKPTPHLSKIKNDKTKILLYPGGFLNNGITSSVINLLNAIDYNQYDVTLIDYGNNTKEEKQSNLSKINKNVKHLFRVGSWNATLSEWYRHNLVLQRGAYSRFMQRVLPEQMYKRELERITGGTEFDIGIDFSGYSPFWTSLIGFGSFKKKSIFLHNDMGMEIQKKVLDRYPHRKNLKVIFSLYDQFDKVISVSKLTNEQNRRQLSHILKAPQEKMDFVMNSIDYNKILSLKQQAFQYEFGEEHDFTFLQLPKARQYPTPHAQDINFINIGRLGPEKDQKKLISAFAPIAGNHSNAKLYIVGDGDLREQLIDHTRKLGLEDQVIFTGQLENPYLLLDQCDCFVLSSNHEGQPMVLLEALVLRKPIIVTDIPGSRSVVGDGYGMVVDNSIEGLRAGMEHFIQERRIDAQKFDYKKYSEDALAMFYEKVCK